MDPSTVPCASSTRVANVATNESDVLRECFGVENRTNTPNNHRRIGFVSSGEIIASRSENRPDELNTPHHWDTTAAGSGNIPITKVPNTASAFATGGYRTSPRITETFSHPSLEIRRSAKTSIRGVTSIPMTWPFEPTCSRRYPKFAPVPQPNSITTSPRVNPSESIARFLIVGILGVHRAMNCLSYTFSILRELGEHRTPPFACN
jgi:hypothetical protein